MSAKLAGLMVCYLQRACTGTEGILVPMDGPATVPRKSLVNTDYGSEKTMIPSALISRNIQHA